MDHASRIAFIYAMIANAQATIAGMQAENQHRIQRDESLAYLEADFEQVPVTYGITHNQVIEYLRE